MATDRHLETPPDSVRRADRRLPTAGMLALLVALLGPTPAQAQASLVYEDDALYEPWEIDFDSSGNLLVAGWGSDSGFRVTPGGATERLIYWSTFGPDQPIYSLRDMVEDSQGNIYVMFSITRVVYKIEPGGQITPFVTSDDVPAPGWLNTRQLKVDANDNLYILERFFGGIYRATPDGSITEVFNEINEAEDFDVAADGTMYITGAADDDSSVYRVEPSGAWDLLVPADGVVDGITILRPSTIAVDDFENVYVASEGSRNLVRIAPDGSATELVPFPEVVLPSDVQVDNAGNAYVVSSFTDSVLRVDPLGNYEVVVGAAESGLGNRFDDPHRLAINDDGDVAIACRYSDNVFLLETDGTLTEVINAHGVPNSPGAAGFSAILSGPSGETYIAGGATDNVIRVSSTGVVEELIGPDGDEAGQELRSPSVLALDSSGNLFVAGEESNNVLRIEIDGTITTVISPGPGYDLTSPRFLETDASGRVYVGGIENTQLIRWSPTTGAELFFDFSEIPAVESATRISSLRALDDGTVFCGVRPFLFRLNPEGEITLTVNGEEPPTQFLGGALHVTCMPSGLVFVAGYLSSMYQVRTTGEVDFLFGYSAFVNGFRDMVSDIGGNIFGVSFFTDQVVRLEGPDSEVIFETLEVTEGSGMRRPDRMAIGADQSVYVSSYLTTNVYRLDPFPPNVAFLRGDANQDGSITIGDPIAALDFLFQGVGVDCLDAVDFNGSGGVDIADAISGLSFLFSAGAPPPPPYPDCAPGPLPIDCALPTPCP